jgi:hypothetical protein
MIRSGTQVTADDPQPTGRLDHIGRHLGAGTDHQGVVLADRLFQFVGRETGAHIHLRNLGKNVDARLIDGIGNQNLRHDRRWR